MGEIMTVAVGVLTFNRFHLLRRTLESIEGAGYPFDLELVDGGSADPAQRAFVGGCGGVCLSIPTVGESMNVVIGRCLEHSPDVVVFSADDYEYRPGWLRRLMAFWSAAPADIALASLNWEPSYAWNAIEADQTIGSERALIRATVPGSSWSFRADDWRMIGPVANKTGGEDLEVCQRLRANGFRLAALDLSEHIGERESAWGNQSWTVAQPLQL